MATHFSVLAWRIPGTREPGGLLSGVVQSRTQLKQLSSGSWVCSAVCPFLGQQEPMLEIRHGYLQTPCLEITATIVGILGRLRESYLTLKGFSRPACPEVPQQVSLRP